MRVQTIPMVLSNCPFIAGQNVRNKNIYDQLLNHNSLQIWHFQLHLPGLKKVRLMCECLLKQKNEKKQATTVCQTAQYACPPLLTGPPLIS